MHHGSSASANRSGLPTCLASHSEVWRRDGRRDLSWEDPCGHDLCREAVGDGGRRRRGGGRPCGRSRRPGVRPYRGRIGQPDVRLNGTSQSTVQFHNNFDLPATLTYTGAASGSLALPAMVDSTPGTNSVTLAVPAAATLTYGVVWSDGVTQGSRSVPLRPITGCLSSSTTAPTTVPGAAVVTTSTTTAAPSPPPTANVASRRASRRRRIRRPWWRRQPHRRPARRRFGRRSSLASSCPLPAVIRSWSCWPAPRWPPSAGCCWSHAGGRTEGEQGGRRLPLQNRRAALGCQ